MKHLLFALISAILMLGSFAHAQFSISEVPQGLTLQGRIIQPDGLPLENSSVLFNIKVLSPGPEQCVLFEENRTVNMTNTRGVINFVVGASEYGAISVPTGHGLSIHRILKNSGTINSISSCSSGSSYAPQAGDTRKVRVTFTVGQETVTLSPDFSLKSVPYSIESENAVALNGKKSDEFINTTTDVTQSRVDQLFLPANFDGLLALLNPSAAPPVSGAIGVPSSDGSTTPSRDGLIRYDSVTNTYQVSVNNSWQTLSTTNTTVTNGNIASEAVTSDKIMTSAVTTSKIADGAVTSSKIANNSISTSKIVDSAVNSAKILDGSIATVDLANSAVTDAKIASVSGSKVTGDIPGNAAGFNGSLNGDVTGAQGSTSVVALRGRSVSSTAPGAGQILKWNGSAWAPAADDNSGGTITSVAAGAGLAGGGSSGAVSLSLTGSGVAAGWYGDGSYVPRFYVDGYGRVTSVTNVAIVAGGAACGGTPHAYTWVSASSGCGGTTTTFYQCFNGSNRTLGSVTQTASCDGDGDGSWN